VPPIQCNIFQSLHTFLEHQRLLIVREEAVATAVMDAARMQKISVVMVLPPDYPFDANVTLATCGSRFLFIDGERDGAI
jgi:hypothetical protein